MSIPTITFVPMTLEDNIEFLKWSFFEINESMNLQKQSIECIPELDRIDLSLSHDKILLEIENIVSKAYKSKEKEIKEDVIRCNKLWGKYNDKYFNVLSKYLNISFPNSITNIKATIGLIPIFPRYLDDFSFSISPKLDDINILKISAHETLHFLWFEKWKQLFPNCKREEFESPFNVWKYSEMVVDFILNSQEIKDVFILNEKAYDYFYSFSDNGQNVMNKLCKIYQEDLTIEDKIKKGFRYIDNYFNKNS